MLGALISSTLCNTSHYHWPAPPHLITTLASSHHHTQDERPGVALRDAGGQGGGGPGLDPVHSHPLQVGGDQIMVLLKRVDLI